MKQLRQSKFKKGTTEYENISSPNGEVKAFKVNSVSGNLEYTTDYTNFSEVGGGQECLVGTTDPTTATVGEVGQFYLNITTNKLFQCQSAGGGSYTWGVPNVNAVTLGTETQTFSGKTKILNLPTSSSTASYLRIQKDSTHYLTLSLNTFTNTDNLHIGVRNGDYESKLLGGGIRFRTYLLSFPSKNGTFALTSDIPSALTNAEIDTIMDAILV